MVRARVVVVLALCLLAIRAALPVLAGSVIEGVLSRLLAGSVSIGEVDLGLFQGRMSLHEAVLTSQQGAELARARRILLDASWAALVGGTLEAELIAIEGPELSFLYDAGGRFNWADVLRGTEAASPDDEPAAAFLVKIAQLEIGEGVVRFVDESPEGPPDVSLFMSAFALEGAEIGRPEPGAPLTWALASARLQDWRLAIAPENGEALNMHIRAQAGPASPDGVLPFDLEVRLPDGARFSAKGDARFAPLGLQLKVHWEDLQSRAVLPLLALHGVRVDRGKSDGELDLELTLADVEERGLRLQGKATHTDLMLAIPADDRETTLEVERATVELAELWIPIPVTAAEPPEPVRVHFSRVDVEKAALDLTQPEASQAAAPLPATEPPRGLEVRFDAISLRDSSIQLHHRASGADFPMLSAIQLDATGVQWPDPSCERVDLVVGSLGRKPLRLEGTAGLGSADLSLSARGIPLVPWNPLIAHYTPYSVTGGSISLESRFELSGEQYEASTELTLNHLRATSRGAFEQAFGMPLTKAIPLLSDSAGNIKLVVPVHGNLTEGWQLDLQPIVTRALAAATTNAIQGATGLAMRTTGSVLRRVSEVLSAGIGEVSFHPGEDEIPRDAQVVLASAAKLVASGGGRLLLIPEIVTNDLLAFGVAKKSNLAVVDSVVGSGRVIFGGSSKLAAETQHEVAALARARVAAILRYIEEKGLLEPDQISAEKWDGRLHEGNPRVLLRVRARVSPEGRS